MPSSPTQCKAWILNKRPKYAVNLSDGPDATFVLKTIDIAQSIPDDSLLVKLIWLSNDPAQRPSIQEGLDPERHYRMPPVEGEVMQALGLAEIIKVGGSSDTYKEGNLILASTGWSEYAVVKKAMSWPITPIPGLSPSVFVGFLGGPGLTAYWGLVDVLKLKAGETLVVSGAAGAVGNVVVQLAKNVFGAKRVIAIVGSNEKAEYVKSLGADVALNYKASNFEQGLIDATPERVETYFDNVGGKILDLVLLRMKRYGRVAACGAISGYNDRSKSAVNNYFEIISSSITVQGFIVADYLSRREGMDALRDAYKSGKLVIQGGETIVEVQGIEEVPKVWHKLFEGKNQGKLVTKLPE